MDLFNYHPRRSHEVRVGSLLLGGDQPLALQSMTTTPTTDVEASVRQAKAIADAGAALVRLTTQGQREVQALQEVRRRLREEGCDVPLVADVHFNPAVADAAAAVVEKVRINPGNYVDPARQFKNLAYTDEEYAAELQRLEARFHALLDICRAHGTALRIGVNHGSLSDRIMSRYGDTPAGIVESCMEFLRICQKEGFRDVVVSIKASNTRVMVHSMRRLVAAMEREGMTFPLHLGVTEAGAGEDGRIKSAVGIGALLTDGIGDTLRVSLSEDPEREVPVAHALASYAVQRAGHDGIPALAASEFSYTEPVRRPTHRVGRCGGGQTPAVFADFSQMPQPDADRQPDYVYCGRQTVSQRREGVRYILDADILLRDPSLLSQYIPAYTAETLLLMGAQATPEKVLFLTYGTLTDEVRACLRLHPETIVVSGTRHQNPLGEHRALVHDLWRHGLQNPVVFFQQYAAAIPSEEFALRAAVDLGALLMDDICDGLYLRRTEVSGLNAENQGVNAEVSGANQEVSGVNASASGENFEVQGVNPEVQGVNPGNQGVNPVSQGFESEAIPSDVAFSILQAARLRTTRTEYISCPGCGRTLYDLPATLAAVRAVTSHLKGVKIAVMGCIVNGPGEMADADYGYVGAARGCVSLYRGRTCVERNIPAAEAPHRLLALIEADRARS